MEIREFQKSDTVGCLALFDSHGGQAFQLTERTEFENYLALPQGPYYVAEFEGSIVACGGFCIQNDAARLTWGMVTKDLTGKGIGKLLLLYRLREISKAGISKISLDTSQHSAGFFEKFGFRIVSRETDGYGDGLHKLEMVKKMEVCA
jgi:N-acetylglutamate synthase-like GNAT family acetyltransferase